MKKDWYRILHSSLGDLAHGKTSEYIQPRLFVRRRKEKPLRAPRMLKRMRVFYVINLLARLVKSNSPLAEGLAAAAPSAPSWALGRSLYGLSQDLERGLSLDEAMRRQPGVFPPVYADLVEAGQKTGTLEQTLTRLMDEMMDTKTVAREIKGLVWYFVIVLAIFVVFSIFLNTKVMPVFDEVVSDIDVPRDYVPWHVYQLSTLVRSYWEWYTAGAGVLALVLLTTLLPAPLERRLRFPQGFRKAIGRIVVPLPLIGRLAKSANIATSVQMLAQLLEAGVPLDAALNDLAESSINPWFAAVYGRMRDKVRQGATLSEAAESESRLLPKSIAVAAANAEYHGDLAGALRNIGLFYRAKTFRQMKMVKPLLLPLFIVILGSFVLTQYMSVFISSINMGERILGGM